MSAWGFTKQWVHLFEPGCPAFVSIAHDQARLFLSEHRGDARPDTLVHLAASLLLTRTGQDVAAWNRRVAAAGLGDEQALRAWLDSQGVTGYGQALLVWERFGYPDFLTAEAEEHKLPIAAERHVQPSAVRSPGMRRFRGPAAGNRRASVSGHPFASADDRHFVIVVSRGGDLPTDDGDHVLVQAFGFGRIDNGVCTSLPCTTRVLPVSAAW